MKLKYKIKIFYGLLLIICMLAVFIFWLFSGNFTSAKEKILNLIPIPIAFVERQPVYASELLANYNDYKALQDKEFKKSTITKQQILIWLFEEKKLNILAQRNKVIVDLENFADLPKNKIQNISLVKRASNWQALDANMRYWFHSKKELNKETYDLLNNLQTKINNGEDFGILAQNYSQDQSSLSLQGDLGPILAENLLFELREPLMQTKIGQAIILPSRLGIHLILPYLKKLSEEGKDMLYLKQIYVTGENFEEWFKNETKNYSIKQFTKF